MTTKADVTALYRLWGHLPRVFRQTTFESRGYGGARRIDRRCAAVDANIITSEVQNTSMHAPVLDIDMPCALVPSSTPGHFHLLIEKGLTWRQYRRLLRALGRAGILERGFVHRSIARRYSAVRVPWEKK
jgi:hypothetical protein